MAIAYGHITLTAVYDGDTGATGQGISSITEEYYLSTSKTTQTGGSWVETPPTWSTGKYIWTRSKIVWSNPIDTTYTTPIVSSEWEAVNAVVPDIDAAAANASSALSKIDDIYSDKKVTPDEKQSLKREWDIIVAEKPANDAQATAFGITTEKTTYGTKYTALNTYINTTYPLFTNLTTTTTIDAGSTLRTRFKEYYDARTALLNAIAAKAKALADAAQAKANQAASDLSSFESSVNTTLGDLQNQIDGSITTWFYPVAPTTSNVPASTWTTTDLKNAHLGDLYYDTQTGYAYRWQLASSTYSWARITDTDVTKALADAQAAQDTADSKRRVFTAQPAPPYDIGDLWTQGTSGDLMRCKKAKQSGTYAAADWEPASKYTDNSAAVVSSDVEYYLSTSSSTPTGGSWQTTAPAWVNGKFMFSRTKITYGSGTTVYTPSSTGTNITGAKGADGKGIVSAAVTYQNHTNGTTAPTGTWSPSIPTPVKGKYLWTRTITTYTIGDPITTYSVSYYATDGTPGAPGKGISSTEVRYQQHTSGSSAPTGTWLEPIPAPVKGKYLWTRTIITYTDGNTSTSYSTSYYATDGADGADGADGRGIASQTTFYAVSSSATVAPTSGWKVTMPTWTSGQHLWLKIATAFTSGPSVESSPICASLPADSKTAIIPASCTTAVGTAAKVVTSSITPQVNDLLLVTYTYGNTANATTIALNGGAAKPVKLNGRTVNGSTSSAGYVAAGSTQLYVVTATEYSLTGSSVIADNNSWGWVNLNIPVDPNSIEGATGDYIRYALVGVTTNNTLEKISKSMSNAAGSRVFTGADRVVEGETVKGIRFPMDFNVYVSSSSTTAWLRGAVSTGSFYTYLQVGWSSMKYPIGEYYNASGERVTNGTAPTMGWQLFIGGDEEGREFVPREYSFCLRNESYVYKRIGVVYNSSGAIAIITEQPMFKCENGEWMNYFTHQSKSIEDAQKGIEDLTNALEEQRLLVEGQRDAAIEAAKDELIAAQKQALADLKATIDERVDKIKAANDAIDALLNGEIADRKMVIRTETDEDGDFLYLELGYVSDEIPFTQRQTPFAIEFLHLGEVISEYTATGLVTPSATLTTSTALTLGIPGAVSFDFINKSNGSLSIKPRTGGSA